MPATKVAATTPFIARGVTRVVLIPTIADTATFVPTRSEINAGTDVADEISEFAGWSFSVNYVDLPRFGQFAIGQLAASRKGDASSLTFYRNTVGTGPHTLFTPNASAFIAWLYGGDVAASKMDIFRTTVASVTPLPTLADEAMRTRVDFSIVGDVIANVTIPT